MSFYSAFFLDLGNINTVKTQKQKHKCNTKANSLCHYFTYDPLRKACPNDVACMDPLIVACPSQLEWQVSWF